MFIFIPIFLYFAVLYYIERTNLEMTTSRWIIFWFSSISIRIFVLSFPIGLSDDIYRYVWDGNVQIAGYNPYLFSPDAQELVHIRQEWWHLINNSHVPSPYPPFSQIVFWILSTSDLGISDSILLFRCGIVVFDLGICYILIKILKLVNKSPRRVIVYAWSPLTIFEFAGNGHNDAIAVFFMLAAIYFTFTNKSKNDNVLAGVCLSIAILTKTFPLFVLPFLMKYWKKSEIFAFLTSFVGISLVYFNSGIYFPFFPEGQWIFLRDFRFNESLYRVIEFFLALFLSDVQEITFLFVLIVVTSIIVLIIWKFWSTPYIVNPTHRIINSITLVFLLLLLFASDIQPWYILWLLPFAVFNYNSIVIIWSASVLLSYQIYLQYDATGIWKENTLILLLEYIPVYSVLTYQLVKYRVIHKLKSK
jgi:hypothetical protein